LWEWFFGNFAGIIALKVGFISFLAFEKMNKSANYKGEINE